MWLHSGLVRSPFKIEPLTWASAPRQDSSHLARCDSPGGIAAPLAPAEGHITGRKDNNQRWVLIIERKFRVWLRVLMAGGTGSGLAVS